MLHKRISIKDENNMGTRKKMTLLSAIEQVVDAAEGSALSEEFMEKVKRPIGYICKKLSMSKMEAVLFALLVDTANLHYVSLGVLTEYLKCRNVRILRYINEIDALERRHYLRRTKEKGEVVYNVPHAVLQALKNDESFVPPSYKNISATAFFSVMHGVMSQRETDEISTDTLYQEIVSLMEDNMQLGFVQQVNKMDLSYEDFLLLMKFCDIYVDENDDDICFFQINDLFDDSLSYSYIKESLKANENSLQEMGLIEFNTDEGFVNTESFRLTNKSKRTLLAELNIKRQLKNEKLLTHYSTLAEKKLFYNDTEQQKVEQLTSLLMPDNYDAIRQRLADAGMRQGFACLFYGAPGTGKTETVYQLARQTHRCLMKVNISDIKSKWVGDSEKNIKRIFDDYRLLAERQEDVPILLFDEADAVIGRRNGGADSAVEKMENTLQNIILQEMESLNGILIATTNLSENFDRAFERRFLYKIEFRRPSLEAMKNIWLTLLPELHKYQATILAKSYSLSGGQIENITRKYIIESVLIGVSPSFEKLQAYCREELSMSSNNGKRIGFV